VVFLEFMFTSPLGILAIGLVVGLLASASYCAKRLTHWSKI